MAMQVLKDTFMPFGRSKEMNGNYEHSRTDYAERVKEKQAAERAERAKEAEKAAEEKKNTGCPNHRTNTSAVKSREKSLRDCTG